MRLLDGILGDWRVVTEIITQDGDWTEQSVAMATFEKRLNGLLISEIETERLSWEGQNPALELDITFDQYRDVYRLSVIDDGWGIMDVYEGELEDAVLTVTNLKSGTSYPLENGGELFFKLEIPVSGDERVMNIGMSSDKGETWRPFYRVTYKRVGE